jgi:hypothetical protein
MLIRPARTASWPRRRSPARRIASRFCCTRHPREAQACCAGSSKTRLCCPPWPVLPWRSATSMPIRAKICVGRGERGRTARRPATTACSPTTTSATTGCSIERHCPAFCSAGCAQRYAPRQRRFPGMISSRASSTCASRSLSAAGSVWWINSNSSCRAMRSG